MSFLQRHEKHGETDHDEEGQGGPPAAGGGRARERFPDRARRVDGRVERRHGRCGEQHEENAFQQRQVAANDEIGQGRFRVERACVLEAEQQSDGEVEADERGRSEAGNDQGPLCAVQSPRREDTEEKVLVRAVRTDGQHDPAEQQDGRERVLFVVPLEERGFERGAFGHAAVEICAEEEARADD